MVNRFSSLCHSCEKIKCVKGKGYAKKSGFVSRSTIHPKRKERNSIIIPCNPVTRRMSIVPQTFTETFFLKALDWVILCRFSCSLQLRKFNVFMYLLSFQNLFIRVLIKHPFLLQLNSASTKKMHKNY